MRMLAEGCLERYLKKLIGRTEMEDALKKLDKLTQEEARMAAAENLNATYAVDKRVQGVADTVVATDIRLGGVDDRVAGVSDQVAGVGNQLASVDNRVAIVDDKVVTVDDRVRVVDNRVIEVIAGMYNILSQFPKRCMNIESLRHAANGQRCRSSEGNRARNGHRCRSSETFVIS